MINIYNNYIYDVLKTWGGENEEERIIIGVLEEAGELSGKIKKRLRGDDISDDDQAVEAAKRSSDDSALS